MKIVQINSVCGIRSTGRICTDIAEALGQDGHECKIAYGRETVPEKYEKYAVRVGSDFGVKVHAGLSRIFDRSGFYSKKATKKFVKWIKEYDPDIIHLHNLHGYYINIKILFDYLKKANKPVIWTLHDCWPFTGHCSYFDYIGCNKWQTLCRRCPQKKKYPASLIFDNSEKNYKIKSKIFNGISNLTIVTPSEWLAQLLKQSFFKDYPVKVINNGIDLTVFKPTPSDFKEKNNLLDKKIILGVASVWDARKGLNDFVELSKLLDDAYKIVLVGISETQKRNLPTNILTISRTNSISELAEIYSASYVLFNPTYEDNYPTVNLEAQACGTPVITYNSGGSAESVPDGNVVEKADINGAYRLINDGQLEVNAGILSVDMMAGYYIDLYNKIII